MDRHQIDDQTLLDYAAGTLDAERRAAVERAVQADAELAATVRRYQMTAGTFATDDSVEPPAHVVAAAKAIVDREPLSDADRLFDAVRTVIASLVYDSRVQPASVRSTTTGAPVMLTFAVEDVSLDLQITPGDSSRPNDRRVIGQVSAESGAAPFELSVHTSAGERTLRQNISAESAFTLNLVAGRYEFRVSIDDRTVVIPDIDLT